MQNHQQSDRLSWGDTVFLHLEREGMPLNVASVCIFEGEIPFEDCVQFVESKLPLLPRFLKRVLSAPFSLGLPTWEYDSEFDLRRHVREVTLKHGTDIELRAFAAKLFGTLMDRQHPLWDISIVRGLKGNRTGLILRMHHCLTDGIAGVGILNALLDATPDAPRLPKRKMKFRVPPPRDPIDCADDRFRRFLFRFHQTNSLRYDGSPEHGRACCWEWWKCGHQRVRHPVSRNHRVYPSGSGSTLSTAGRKNSPALRSHWPM